MTLWIIQRLLQAILVALAMAVIVFVGLHLIGSPIETLLPAEATHEDRLRLIADLGLDRPLYEQFFLFLKGVLQGNLGISYVYKEPAVELILSRLPATLEPSCCRSSSACPSASWRVGSPRAHFPA